jgi:multiple sugar transport system substrate-binding protein
MRTPNIPRRRFLQLSFGAGAAAVLSGCGSDDNGAEAVADVDFAADYDGPEVTLSFWNGFTGGDGPFLHDLVEEFNEQHGNITVDTNTLEWADYYSSVPAAVSRGEGPDVGVMHLDQLGTNAARGVIVPLERMVDALGLDASDFHPQVWDAGTYAGSRYGIPLDIHPLGFYYNRSVLDSAGLDPDSPPTNHDEFMAALEAMSGQGIRGHWISPFMFTGGLEFQSLLPQFGGSLYNDDATEAAWNSDAGVAALEWMVSLIDQGYSPRDVGQDAESIAFTNDDNGFIFNGIWMINGYGDDPDLDWGVAPLPTIGSQPGVWASSHNFVLMNKPNQDPNVMQAAGSFVNWISEHSLQWAEAGQIPARATVRDGSEFQALEYQPTFAEQLDYAVFAPSVPGVGDAQGEMATAVEEAVLGTKDPGQALEDAAGRANQLLEAARERYSD